MKRDINETRSVCESEFFRCMVRRTSGGMGASNIITPKAASGPTTQKQGAREQGSEGAGSGERAGG